MGAWQLMINSQISFCCTGSIRKTEQLVMRKFMQIGLDARNIPWVHAGPPAAHMSEEVAFHPVSSNNECRASPAGEPP